MRFHGPLVFIINHKQYSAGEVGHQNIWDTPFTLSLNKEYVQCMVQFHVNSKNYNLNSIPFLYVLFKGSPD